MADHDGTPTGFECAICLDECAEPVSAPCGHNFCKGCLVGWVASSRGAARSPKCPLCNRVISVELQINRTLESALQQLQALRIRPVTQQASACDNSASFSLCIDDIDVGEEIGTGGFATVHRGSWHGAPVALKIPTFRVVGDSPAASRILREIALLAKLRHPNIVSLYGMARRDDGGILIVTKLGRHSLWDEMRGGNASGDPTPLPLPVALRIAIGVARALHYLHARTPPVVHCDIKSANVILDEHGAPMLADFGVSRELSTATGPTTTGGARGTSAWCAPENFDDEHPLHGKPPSDVYSLGVLINEMLAGACPFLGRGDVAIMTAVLNRQQRPALAEYGVYTALKEIVVAAWAQDPIVRPSAAVMLQRLLLMHAEQETAGMSEVGKAPPPTPCLILPAPSAPPVTSALPTLLRPARATAGEVSYGLSADVESVAGKREPRSGSNSGHGGGSGSGGFSWVSTPSAPHTLPTTPSHTTAAADDVAALRIALSSNPAHINALDHLGWTPMHVAAANNAVGAIQELLLNNAETNPIDKFGCTPVMLARQKGALNAASLLDLGSGEPRTSMEKEAADQRESVRKEAQRAEDERHVRLRALPRPSSIIFMKATRDGDFHAVRDMIDGGADVNSAAKDRTTPLHIAAEIGHKNIAALLLKHGVNLHVARTYDGSLPLHIAISNGNTDVAAVLLECGANVNAAKANGATPLHIAVEKGHKDIIALLLEHGANINASGTLYDGYTPLHIVASNGREDLATMLLKRGANVNATTKNGATPLHNTALLDKKNIAVLLLEFRANVNAARTVDGYTPLHIIASIGQKDFAAVLLERGANVNATSTNGGTPLHLAARSTQKNVAALLLAHGANVNAMRKDGSTPLHSAAENGHEDVAALLLERGANINAKTNDGRTAFKSARDVGKVEMAAFLKSRGAKTGGLLGWLG